MTSFLTASEQRANSQDDILLFDEITTIEKAILEASEEDQYETTIATSPMTDTNFIPSTLATLETSMKSTNMTITSRGYDYVVGNEYTVRNGTSLASTYELNGIGIILGGLDYVIGDRINLIGGDSVNSNIVVLEVSTINTTNGLVTGLTIIDSGEYTSIVQDPIYTTTDGSGEGLVITTSWITKTEDLVRIKVTEIDGNGAIVNYEVLNNGNYITLPTNPIELDGIIVGDITSSTHNQSVDWEIIDVTSVDSKFSLDGLRLLRMTQNVATEYQTLIDYRVDTPFDNTTIITDLNTNMNRTTTFVKENVSDVIMSANITCFTHEDNGNYMFVLDKDVNKLFKITLPEPYVSNIYNNHISSTEIRVDTQYPQTVDAHLNLSSEIGIESYTLPIVGQYYRFTPDGMKIIILESLTGNIYQYSLAFKYDLSAMTLDGSISLQTATPMSSFNFRDGGMKLVSCGVNDYNLYSFQLASENSIIGMTDTTAIILTISNTVLTTPITNFIVMDNRNKLWVGSNETFADYDIALSGPHGATFDLEWGIKEISVMNGGLGYKLAPLVVIGQTEDQGQPSAISTIEDTMVNSIEVLDGGYGYIEIPTVSLIIQGLATEYYYVWVGVNESSVKTDQMNKVIKNFQDKGYSMIRISNPDTTNTFIWKINW